MFNGHIYGRRRFLALAYNFTNGNGSNVSFAEYLRAPLGKTAVPVACKGRFGSSRYVSPSQITRFLLFLTFCWHKHEAAYVYSYCFFSIRHENTQRVRGECLGILLLICTLKLQKS